MTKKIKQPGSLESCSGNDEWNTPSQFVESARKVMGSIDTDPASNDFAQENIIHAAKYYMKEYSSLNEPWHGNIWLNPPYGRGKTAKFVSKLIKELKK